MAAETYRANDHYFNIIIFSLVPRTSPLFLEEAVGTGCYCSLELPEEIFSRFFH